MLPVGVLHHIGLVVPDLQRAATTIEHLYGMAMVLFDEIDYPCRIDGVEQVVTQRMGLSAGCAPHIELIRAVPGSPVWAATPGVHHVGFVVDDLAAASARVSTAGAPIWMGGVAGDAFPAGACYHRDPLGQVVELLDHATAARLADRLETQARIA